MHAVAGLASYPSTIGSEPLRTAIAGWLERRYGLPALDAGHEVLPVNGSREALFAIAQCVIDASKPDALVVCPNPFYQIYEGAAYLAGATPYFVNSDPARNFAPDYASVPDDVWPRVQLLYRLLARQPDRRHAHAGRLARAVRAVRPLRLRDRGRRMLFRDLHGQHAAAGRAGSGAPAGPQQRRAALPQPDRVLQPVEALERAGHALGLRRGRSGAS